MINVSKATEIVLNNLFTPGLVAVKLVDACGRVLQEEIRADRDFPPFDRVTMDGIAYQYKHWDKTKGALPVEGVQIAGSPRLLLKNEAACMEVMTGAMLPENTDTVTRYEDVVFSEENGQKVAEIKVPPQPGQDIHRQGIDRKKGDLLLSPGQKLGPAEIAVAASVGKTILKVSAWPRIVLITTGDELVHVSETPQPYQIRQSNVHALSAALDTMNIPAQLLHFPDNKETITRGIQQALAENDVLILSGGVSKGKHDYVPEALEISGVTKQFHRVEQRPGKPFWFGSRNDGKTVFALPGNPVSTFMCFYRYVRPWLLRSEGLPESSPVSASLQEDVHFDPPLTYFLQVKVQHDAGKLLAQPFKGHGSGDFANLMSCDGFLELPPDRDHFKAGENFPLILFREI